MPPSDHVAIVGLGCLFPAAPDLATYWRNVVEARDGLGEVPPDHSWSPDDLYDADPHAADKSWCTRGGFLDAVPFDPMAFGIPPAMLESIDTTQLLSLLVAREALRDAGLDPDDPSWDRDRVSVILGVTGTQELAVTAGARLQGPVWRKALLRCGVDPELADLVVRDIANHFPAWTEQTFPGLLGNVVAGRIANRLDLGGTNAVVDAACASSLAAVQYAMSDLLADRSDLVLTGGADTMNDAFMFQCFTRTPAFSRKGDARPFDAEADGILIGEGIALLALKRLADAERDGDRIYAVVRGIGSSSDGRHKSIYAPNPDGQEKALRRTYAMAGVTPDTVELVEAHGTGTRAGDAAEIDALTRVYGDAGRVGRWAALGSVKALIGHTKSTAGAAGLMKAALALHHRVLPPAAKIERPNPKMNFDRSPFYLSPRARPWFGTPVHPRRAAVSAFGFGGSNFHAVLEEHGTADGPGFGAPVAELFLVGAESHDDLARQVRALGGPTVAHAARAALAEWQPGRSHVAAFLAGSLDELEERVAIVERRWAGASPRPGDGVSTGGGPAPRVAFLFPGQGSQYLEMGRTLALRHPTVRHAFERADEVLGFPLTARVFPPPAWTDAERRQHEQELQATEIAQPAIGVLSLGMAQLLARFGVVPSAAAGHSYGELVALCVAGALDEDTLLRASAARGQLMSASGRDRGGMAAIDGPLEVVERLVDGVPDVVVANRNHPAQAVVSGPAEAVAVVLRRAADAGFTGRELRVAAAFHSPLVADAERPFRDALGALPVGRPSFPVIAGALAAPYPDDPDGIRDLLARSLVLPVDWVGAVQALVAGGAELLLEVGPRGVLAGLAERCVPDVPVLALDRQADRADGDVQLKATLAALAAAGVPVDPTPLVEQRLPSAPRSASGPATVWLAGANYRKPETRMPPKPVLPVPPSEGWGAVPSSGTPMDRPVHLERDVPASAAAPVPAASTDLLALLESTRATLAAFQDAQAKTAEVHARFLDAVHHANDNFARLFEAQTRLVERVAGGGVLPVHVTAPEVRMPPPPAPEPVRAAARPLPASVPLANPDRPAVATDLPPLLDARAAVAARSAPAPTPNEPAILGPGRTPPRYETLVAALLDAVARKTGYPREALELSMDLEADLGVDSIKRVEILSAVREILPELPEIDAEALGALRTLADVAEHLAGVAAGLGFALIGSEAVGRRQPDLLVPEPAPPQAHVPEPAPPPVMSARDLDPSPPVFLRRSSVRVVPAPEGVTVASGGRWLVAHDTQGRAARVVAALAARGVDAQDGDPADGPWAGVVHLGAIGLSGDALRDAVRGAFELARAVGPVGFFATVSGRGGRFGRAPATGEPLEGALAGLPRTLAREWPGCRALALDIDPDLDAALLADELLRDRGTVDVGRTAHEAFTLAAVSDSPEGSPPDLHPGDLVVVTGGARGVTAACALALARAVPVSLLLLGRTELVDEPAWARGVPDGDLLAAAVKAARRAEEALAPRDADRRAAGVRAGREVRATIRAAERAGASCTYRSVDVRDRAAVAAFVTEAVVAHGPVRLVVHGAGVLADRKVVDKTPAQFDEVFSTKVDGLDAVLAACPPNELRSVAAFTSIAGRRGNAGQVDYAMANEAVVQRLLGLPCHVRAIDWGPWAGGMVTPALAAHFAAQGLRPIPLDEGAATFLAELGRGGEVEVVVEAPRTPSGTVERVLSARVPFLRDHRIGGRPVLPAAMVLEWMAELSAEVAPGRRVAAVERFEVLKGITLDAPERVVTVVWEQATPDTLEIEVQSPAVSKGHTVRHYRASVRLEPAVLRPAGRLSATPPKRPHWPGSNGLSSETYPYAVGEAYDRFLFHGPALHGIDEIVGWSDHGIVAWLRTSEPRGLGVAAGRWETDPLVVDAALQLMCLWVREKLGSAALPSGFGVWRQLAPFSGRRVAAHLSMDAGATTRGGRFDVAFVDEHGAVVAELGRATYTGEPSLLSQFRSGS